MLLILILEKYYNKEIVNTFTSITLFIISIISANLLIRLFQRAYSQGLGIDAIGKFVVLTLPENVALIAPIAMFLSIIVCFGKWFANNEMFVTLAGGVTWMEIVKNAYKPVLALTVTLFFTTAYLVPLSKQTSDYYQSSLSAESLLSSITDGKIIKPPQGRILYVTKKKGDVLHDVFLYQKDKTDNDYKVVMAPTATVGASNGASNLTFHNANIYSYDNIKKQAVYGTADKAIYQIFDNTSRNYNHSRLDRIYLGKLITKSWSGDKNYLAQLTGKLNNCISVLVAGLLALAMCQVRPRQNKYAKLLPSVIVLALYLCAVMFTNTSIDKLTIPAWIGIWLPHIFFVIYAIRTIRKQNGS